MDARTAESVSITLADGTILPDCRPDLLSIGYLMARGWSIIPLRARSKVPAVKWEPYQRRLATLEELETWFTRPGSNVGIVTGTISGIFVVDCDSPEALRGPARRCRSARCESGPLRGCISSTRTAASARCGTRSA